jgi:hypothetical protein
LYVSIGNTNINSFGYIEPQQPLEGYTCSDFAWGTPFGVPITVSFWFRTNVAAGSIFSVTIRNSSQYAATFSATGGGAWQYVTLVFPPPPNGSTWGTGTALFGNLMFFARGSGTAANSPNTWINGYYEGSSIDTNWYATSGNFVEWTGVQLEKGTIATPFEVRPYATELALCQRYYYQITATTNSGGVQSAINWGIAYVRSAGNASVYYSLPVPMRAQPTFSNTAALQFDWNNVSNLGIFTSPVLNTTKSSNKDIEIDGGCTGGTQGQAGAMMLTNVTAGQYAAFNAEL